MCYVKRSQFAVSGEFCLISLMLAIIEQLDLEIISSNGEINTNRGIGRLLEGNPH